MASAPEGQISAARTNGRNAKVGKVVRFADSGLARCVFVRATLVSRFGGGRIGQTAVLIAFAFGLFHVSRTVGSQDGRALRSRFQQLPEVKFVLKDTALEQRLTTQQDWVGTSFLITATKDKYLVLVQKPPDPQFPDRWPAATTLVVPASEAIAGIQVKDVQKVKLRSIDCDQVDGGCHAIYFATDPRYGRAVPEIKRWQQVFAACKQCGQEKVYLLRCEGGVHTG